MKIDKAIEIIPFLYINPDSPFTKDFHDAIQLGLEALKEVKKARQGDPALDGDLLPGETDE